MKILAPLTAACLLASALGAQSAAPSARWKPMTVSSKLLGAKRTLLVSTPVGYETDDSRYPVLLLLDADDTPQFDAAVSNLRFLSDRSEIPRLIIVGVTNGSDRTHDLTPSATGSTAKQFPTAGGAAVFTNFLIDEVLPAVRSKYRTMPMTILAGHSFGGLLALHAASARPEAFTGVIAMSPSLWWNDSTAATAYADSVSRATRLTRLFAANGEFEPPIDANTRRFAARLDSTKGSNLTFAYRRYPDNTHGLMPVPGLMDGIRFVFRDVSLAVTPLFRVADYTDSAAVMNAFIATRDQYAKGARALGLAPSLPEDFANMVAYGTLQQFKMPHLAEWMFRQNAANYPTHAKLWDALGDGMLAVGDTTGAIAQFRKALATAAQAGQPADKDTRAKLAKLTCGRATRANPAKRCS